MAERKDFANVLLHRLRAMKGTEVCEQLSDFVLVGVDGQEHKVHRFMLAASSDHFHDAIFAHDNKESSEGRYTISPELDPQNHVASLIDFMYTGKIDLSPDNVVGILKLADFWQMSELVTELKAYLEKALNDGPSFPLYRACVEVGYSEYRKMARVNISSMFLHANQNYSDEVKNIIRDKMISIQNTDIFLRAFNPLTFSYLPNDVMLTLLSSNSLLVVRELEVFRFVVAMVEELKSKMSGKPEEEVEQFVTKLLLCVRYRYLSKEEFDEVLSSEYGELLPKDFLLAHFLVRNNHPVLSGLKSDVADIPSLLTLPDRQGPLFLCNRVKDRSSKERRF